MPETTIAFRKRGLPFVLFAFFSTPLMALFAYNSTYGYDQLEYLIIGRGIVEGHPLFTFVPSKGPGIYLLVAFLNYLGVQFGHLSLSITIAAVYLAMIIATFVVGKRVFGAAVALIGSMLVGLCVVFMSLNFLQPTGFVYLSGLWAFYLVATNLSLTRRWPFALAGLALGLGFLFKSVSAFYVVAIFLFLLIHGFRTRRVQTAGLSAIITGAGFALALALPLIYFSSIGRASDFLEWTIYFPLLKYPAHTLWLDTLYKKLVWFHAILLLSAVWSVMPARRRSIYADPALQLALWMGVCSYAALLKTQGANYCFPGAGFLSLFIAVVVARTIETPLTRMKFIAISIGASVLLVLMVAGVLLHRPAAFLRFFSVRDYSDERVLARYLSNACPPRSRALFFSGNMRLYWISHLYPAVPFVNMNVQTAYLLQKNPSVLLESLDDPNLALVEFRRSLPGVAESEQFEPERFTALLDEFEVRLKERFVPLSDSPEGYALWRRR